MPAGQGGIEIISVQASQGAFVDNLHAQLRESRKILGLLRPSRAKGQAGHDLIILKIGPFQIQAEPVLVHDLDDIQIFHHNALLDPTGCCRRCKVGKCRALPLLRWFDGRAQALVEHIGDGCFSAFRCG